MTVLIRGAGVAGLTLAHELVECGVRVTVTDPRQSMAETASWFAGGMLAPYCERESAEQAVQDLGLDAADWWDKALPGLVVRAGTLVVAASRDHRELDRFAARTAGFVSLGPDDIAALEPDLAGRFRRALHFVHEAHLDPRMALQRLELKLAGMGVTFEKGAGERLAAHDISVDCTGIAGAATDSNLRGVRGEMLIIRSRDISLSRPVRLLHPRFPLYVVPRADHHFMIGATMVETDAAGPMTARSMMELLNAAYSLHPAFAEAEVVEVGVGVRPAYPDNLPRIERDGSMIRINGLYRHGFLLAPAMARQAAGFILNPNPDRQLLHETHH
jgi:glycine oxidase